MDIKKFRMQISAIGIPDIDPKMTQSISLGNKYLFFDGKFTLILIGDRNVIHSDRIRIIKHGYENTIYSPEWICARIMKTSEWISLGPDALKKVEKVPFR